MPPSPRPQRVSPAVGKTIARPAKKSGVRAESNAQRAETNRPEEVPVTSDGRPLVKIEMSAAELIPTGDFANVSVGPARISAWIDPTLEDPFSTAEATNIGRALNMLAEIVEIDVIGNQRELILESLNSIARDQG